MITCKEDLMDTYIINDKGKLREKYISIAKAYEIDVISDFDAYYFAINKDHVDGWHWLDGYYCLDGIASYKKLTLADFIPNKIAPQAPVDNNTFDTHKPTLEENKHSTGVPSPIIVKDGSACDTRKDIFREMLTLARENNCFIQFDGFTEDENDCIVVTFASSDEEYVIQSAADFKKLLSAQETLNKFLRVV